MSENQRLFADIKLAFANMAAAYGGDESSRHIKSVGERTIAFLRELEKEDLFTIWDCLGTHHKRGSGAEALYQLIDALGPLPGQGQK